MRPLRVFLCHSSNDKPTVRELYQKLRAETWIEPWLDEEELYPGQDWNMEIEKAVEAADAIIVCLSKGSITKEGYVQRELRTILRILPITNPKVRCTLSPCVWKNASRPADCAHGSMRITSKVNANGHFKDYWLV